MKIDLNITAQPLAEAMKRLFGMILETIVIFSLVMWMLGTIGTRITIEHIHAPLCENKK